MERIDGDRKEYVEESERRKDEEGNGENRIEDERKGEVEE